MNDEFDDTKIIKDFRTVTGKKRLRSRYNLPKSPENDEGNKVKYKSSRRLLPKTKQS